MKYINLITFFSFLLIGIPQENSYPLGIVMLMALIGFHFQNIIIFLGIIAALSLLCFSKKIYIKIICFLLLLLYLLIPFYNGKYESFKLSDIGTTIISIIMPIIFVVSSYFLILKKEK
ncbi:hypothetical protein [Elizabethkingia anophelis]|uniref:hypothetical protein n=2 Tax=Elizabethkingia anophelis TaxID=1117645 RepID=UPI0004E3E271|nr:hypothetical protein [Elizabethkingia anophelis]KFC38457.1 hypothetical protein FF18_17065 [Elizabethkingia anophelis]MCT3697575.1 hypothetical protein [Elizabethkingia anophelis]MCT3732915.1 hypothetical protein [Elizabethkingia anophelis]MCT3760678.1 hypothetical protein [Elizabethkingia anophelis]MCT3896537.1 hypothetical protein [Elizabethkingia anophelis]